MATQPSGRALQTFADLVQDELNVKEVRLLDNATEAVSHTIKPLQRQLGQKFGNKLPEIQQAIAALDSEDAAKTLLSGGSLRVTVGGQECVIQPDDVEVRAQAKGGFAVAEEGAYVAALVTTLTPELLNEGIAREFVRRVQDLRKVAGLEVSDRIRLFVDAPAQLKAAIEAHRSYVTTETLAVDLEYTAPPADAPQTGDKLDGMDLNLGFLKAA